MAAQSRPIALGTPAPAFALPDPAGTVHRLADIAVGGPFLVAFICNHCPYVKHVAPAFAAFARDYQPRGLAVVAISANDAAAYPEDAPDRMAEFARRHGFAFPYLHDEAQDVARAYDAACTPDLYLFDAAGRLAYHGQFDASRPGRGTPDGADLRAAADAVLAGRPVPGEQVPSVGCSIKWR